MPLRGSRLSCDVYLMPLRGSQSPLCPTFGRLVLYLVALPGGVEYPPWESRYRLGFGAGALLRFSSLRGLFLWFGSLGGHLFRFSGLGGHLLWFGGLGGHLLRFGGLWGRTSSPLAWRPRGISPGLAALGGILSSGSATSGGIFYFSGSAPLGGIFFFGSVASEGHLLRFGMLRVASSLVRRPRRASSSSSVWRPQGSSSSPGWL